MATIRVGLIGVGKHGERYARHAKELQGIELAAISRPNETAGREQARAFGCRYHRHLEELVADPAVDAVVCAVPPTVNPKIVRMAAQWRKPLLIEKPFAASVREGAGMIEELERAGSFCMVAQTLRFNNVVRALKHHLEKIGPVHAVCLSQRFEPSPLGWLDNPAVSGGGIIVHTGVHSFDLLRHLTASEPKAVLAQMCQVATRRTEDNFAAVVLLEPGPIVASVAGSRATLGRCGFIEIAGRKGQLTGDHVHGHADLLIGRTRTPLELGPPTQTVKEVLASFAECLATGKQPPITARDGLAAVAAAEACYRSAQSGKLEPVESLR